MDSVFCSDHARKLGEDIIGTAASYQTYILVECPLPWTYEAWNSKWVPNNLKMLVEEALRAKLPVRFLLIANDFSHKVDHTTVLIYQQPQGRINGYQKSEFQLPNIENVAGLVREYLSGRLIKNQIETNITRDILVCTHGSHDQCCARYGNPFYFHAKSTINDLKMDNVRIWKSSHFGGHRFAPTAIDLPEGRYYGILDQQSLRTILSRTGDIQSLNQVYRGWGILPTAVQILERELMLYHKWDWFDYKVSGKILEKSLDNYTMLVEVTFEDVSGSLSTYQAKLVKDNQKTLEIKSSCNAKDNSICVKYAVESIGLVSKKLPALVR